MISLPSSVRPTGSQQPEGLRDSKLPGRKAGCGVRLFVSEPLGKQEETGKRLALGELENARQH